jgi:peptidoglycan/xylan/chitin deacetylase (PgdA/CDA1 family)
MALAGIEIGSHTHSHPDLKMLTTGAAKREIVTSREQIEKCLKTPVDSFAYPYGSLSPGTLETVRQEFRAACTTELRRAVADPLHELPRIDMYYIRTRRNFERLTRGQLDRYLGIRRIGRAVRAAVSTRSQ